MRGSTFSDLALKRIAAVSILKFYGELEILEDQKSAIITLYAENGEWSGSGRIEHKGGDAESLYEDGYNRASAAATAKGGYLETFKLVGDLI